jgi:hypothetical protein
MSSNENMLGTSITDLQQSIRNKIVNKDFRLFILFILYFLIIFLSINCHTCENFMMRITNILKLL